MPDVIVVGGGIAGISAAVAAARRGARVLLLERERRLGGRASGENDVASDYAIDTGPHILLPSYVHLLQLLEQLGSRQRVQWTQEPAMRVIFDNGHVLAPRARLPTPLSLLPSLWNAPQLSFVNLVSNAPLAMAARFARPRDILAADKLTGERLLRRLGVRDEGRQRLWQPLARALLGTGLDRCSGGSLLRLCGTALRGTAATIGMARCNLSELVSAGLDRQLADAGGAVRLGQTVVAIEPAPRGGWVTQLAHNESHLAQTVIVATPPYVTRRLLGATQLQLPTFEPRPCSSVMMWLDCAAGGGMTTFTSLADRADKIDVFVLSSLATGRTDRAVVGCNISLKDGVEHDDASLVALAMHALRRGVGWAGNARVVRHLICRNHAASYRQTVGFETRRPAQKTPREGLLLAGDWTDTGVPPSMESAALSGMLAANALV